MTATSTLIQPADDHSSIRHTLMAGDGGDVLIRLDADGRMHAVT